MARARSFPVARTRAPRRKTVWIGTADQNDVAVGNGLSVIISSFAPDALAILKATVVRVRGRFTARPAAFTVTHDYSGAFGLGVVSDEALAAGAASIPRPFDDDDWAGWMVHGYYSGHFEFDDATGLLIMDREIVIDSKAMRKVGPNETLVWMAESAESAAQVNIQARVLMMLS